MYIYVCVCDSLCSLLVDINLLTSSMYIFVLMSTLLCIILYCIVEKELIRKQLEEELALQVQF